MGRDGKGTGKYGSNGGVPVRNVQDGVTVGAIIWHRKLVGDRVDAQGTDGVPSLGGATDHGDDRETWGRRRVVVPRGR